MVLLSTFALTSCVNDTGDQPAAITIDSTPGLSLLAGKLGGSGNIDGVPGRFSFRYGNGIVVDAYGNAYVSDSDGSTIRKINVAGAVSTFAGVMGINGSADGVGSEARFGYSGSSDITGMAVDRDGTVYLADSGNNTIRKITAAGVVTTLAGTTGSCGATDGIAKVALFCRPQGLALDAAGAIYVADNYQLIRKISAAGVVTTLAGHLDIGPRVAIDGVGVEAGFGTLAGLAVDSTGTVYAVDWGAIRKITSSGVVTTLAGTAGVRGSADGVGANAAFSNPRGIAVDDAGNVFVADSLNFTIRKITQAGVVTTLAGHAMYAPGYADGIGQTARFNTPIAIAVSNNGTLFVADTFKETLNKYQTL